jgi:prepilin-type N-terminal cleavage/methylation domain-containing protein
MHRMIERARQEEGFTLIELMIVIVILGTLAGIVLFAVNGINDRGTHAACRTDQSTISTAVEAYFAKNNTYPSDLVPSLTSGSSQFLKWDPSFTGTVSATDNGGGVNAGNTKTGSGYTIMYDPTSHDVWASTGGTPDATTTCPA